MASIFDKTEETEQQPVDIQAYFLNYDIPENADIANPAKFLRRFAFHAQLSGWIVQAGDIPQALISRLLNAGATVDLIKFDASETEKLLLMATRSIETEITTMRQSAASSYAKVMEELRNDEVGADTALATFRRKNQAIVKRLTKHLEDMVSCAKRWGIYSRIPCLRTSASGIATLRQTMACRAATYAKAIHAIKMRMGKDDAMAKAMERDEVMAGIAADYMDEMGLDGQALRSMFA